MLGTASRGRAMTLPGSETAMPVRTSPRSRAAIRPRRCPGSDRVPLLLADEPLAEYLAYFRESLGDGLEVSAPGLCHGRPTAPTAAENARDLLDDVPGPDPPGDLRVE